MRIPLIRANAPERSGAVAHAATPARLRRAAAISGRLIPRPRRAVQDRRKSLQRLVAAFHRPATGGSGSILRRPELEAHGQPRAIAIGLERPRSYKAAMRPSIRPTSVRIDDAPRLDHLHEPHVVPVVGPVRAVHRVPPDPARTHVQLVDRGRESVRPPPLDDLGRVGPGRPYPFGGSGQPSRYHDFVFCGALLG